MKGEYWTCPTISDEGYDILVTGRADIEKFRTNPRFSIRVTITWKYGGHDMPGIEDSKLMEQATDAMADTFVKDPVAVLTGIYTGDGSRQWVFYTTSTNIFGRKLNEALAQLPLMPLEITCENDPDWEEYDEMATASRIDV